MKGKPMSDATTVGDVLDEFADFFTQGKKGADRECIHAFIELVAALATPDLVFETEAQIIAFKQAFRTQLKHIMQFEPELDGGASATAALATATFLRTLLDPE
jgi:hypothetical protein